MRGICGMTERECLVFHAHLLHPSLPLLVANEPLLALNSSVPSFPPLTPQVYVFMYKQESMCGGAPIDQQTIRTSRDITSTRLPLSDFCYRVIVFPVNHKSWGPSSDPLYFTFTRLPRQLTLLAGLLTHIHTHLVSCRGLFRREAGALDRLSPCLGV
jgi:hypothetical protein